MRGGPACQRTYVNVAHFENLIEFDDAVDGKPGTATRTGWRYGPFLTTKFGSPGPLDYKHIIGNETEGEWRKRETLSSPRLPIDR